MCLQYVTNNVLDSKSATEFLNYETLAEVRLENFIYERKV